MTRARRVLRKTSSLVPKGMRSVHSCRTRLAGSASQPKIKLRGVRRS